MINSLGYSSSMSVRPDGASNPFQQHIKRAAKPSEPVHPRLYFGNEESPTPPAASGNKKQAGWGVKAMLVAWLATVGGGGFLGYQQHETNTDLMSKNTALVEQMAEANTRMDTFATNDRVNQISQDATRRDAQIQSHITQIEENVGAASESLSQLEGVVNSVQSEKLAEIRENLDNIRARVHDLDGMVISPDTIADVRPQTAMVVAMVNGERAGVGSGVWINDPGSNKVYLLTNQHVVPSDTMTTWPDMQEVPVSFKIQLPGSDELIDATVAYRNQGLDLALLEVDKLPDGIETVEMRDLNKDPLVQGEVVFAMGNPMGLQDSVTKGVISNPERANPNNDDTMLIQTDAPINPGNSGGGLFDSQGRLIGINEMVIRKMPAATDGLGMAIRGDIVKDFMSNWEQMKADEEAKAKAEAEAKAKAEAEAKAKEEADAKAREEAEAQNGEDQPTEVLPETQ